MVLAVGDTMQDEDQAVIAVDSDQYFLPLILAHPHLKVMFLACLHMICSNFLAGAGATAVWKLLGGVTSGANNEMVVCTANACSSASSQPASCTTPPSM